ncbi:hypothetical protein ADUPG1_014205 [Aduncisulcus paluster]|uniref:Protein kinase domain-containing protein n=1 Tax=Aduncisulcus paluster TaxID=2918883 RepID=A0ABQ5KD03_9EUKA|nr:hypothetical protein ADUPG1_014205 [Aduncisulcus paluster]
MNNDFKILFFASNSKLIFLYNRHINSSKINMGKSKDKLSGSYDKIYRKHASKILTSPEKLTSKCIIGQGGFGEVQLISIEGIETPCILKRMLRVGDKKVVKECRKEFLFQTKLFMNPRCFNRIPRPFYILDLLNEKYEGVYGFIMEFCRGGSVKDFAKSWCLLPSVFEENERDDEESTSSDSDSDRSDIETEFDSSSLNPLRVASLCIGMIECLDDVFMAKPELAHRDVKPDNFLVHVDDKSGECTIVLADLGLARIQDSISSSSSSKSFEASSSHLKSHDKADAKTKDRSICGTLVYNSFEALRFGQQSQESDAHSLGMSILALFTCQDPFINMPIFRGISDSVDIVSTLVSLMEKNLTPQISSEPLFRTLKTIEDGKFKPVHDCLNEVFKGLTLLDVDKRMKVHTAREKVQSIKHLLPKIGEGWKCPSIENFIQKQLDKFDGYSGSIESMEGVAHSSSSVSALYSVSAVSSWKSQNINPLRRQFKDLEDSLKKPPYNVENLTRFLKFTTIDSEHYFSREGMKSMRYSICLADKFPDSFENFKKWSDLMEQILITPSSSIHKLFLEHRQEILDFFSSKSDEEFLKDWQETLMVVKCLRHFSIHLDISNNLKSVELPYEGISELVDTFVSFLTKIYQILQGAIDEDFCIIMLQVSFQVKDVDYPEILPKVSSTFQDMLKRGSTKRYDGDILMLKGESTKLMLESLVNFSNSTIKATRLVIYNIIKPYVIPWLKLYGTTKYFNDLTRILGKVTWDITINEPIQSICHEFWPETYRITLGIVKDWFHSADSDDIGELHDDVLRFFSNLCSSKKCSLEIFDNLKEFIPKWIAMFKKSSNNIGIKHWAKLISVFSATVSLVPQISPKYDDDMEWCHANGAWDRDLVRYKTNCPEFALRKWKRLINAIKKCRTDTSKATLYRKNREALLSVFDSHQSETQIQKHKEEIILCCQCLKLFGRNVISEKLVDVHDDDNEVIIPLSEYHDIIDTFVDHLSRVMKSLKGMKVEEEFCYIVWDYSYQCSQLPLKKEALLPKVTPLFERILEFGRKPMKGSIPFNLLKSLLNFSNAPYFSLKKSLFALIKPYFSDWFKNYQATEFLPIWEGFLSQILIIYDDFVVIESSCSEIWPLIHPFLESFLKRKEFYGSEFLSPHHNRILLLLASLSLKNETRATIIFGYIKERLPKWIELLKDDDHELGIELWSEFLDDIDQKLCHICTSYSYSSEKSKRGSFLSKIAPIFKRILERGSTSELSPSIACNILYTLKNISFASDSVKKSVFKQIKPYIQKWIAIQKDNAIILAIIKLMSHVINDDDSALIAWEMFHSILKVLKTEIYSSNLTADDLADIMSFFTELVWSFHGKHHDRAITFFNDIKDLLPKLFGTFKAQSHGVGIYRWVYLIRSFSTIDTMIPLIYPKYKKEMKWASNQDRQWKGEVGDGISVCVQSFNKTVELYLKKHSCCTIV